ncbi:hypothetical protein ABYD36_18130 [Escherichia coli]|uniref:hypothetical protein n=1 Tax=Escherichia coli TaxID=562 RepID=UPI0010AC6ABB|nr:hypothetical protein [Escherichia coli]EEW3454486.1 hypothetical protein [Escherichia coli]TJP52631.1 hypothetical protein C9Z81_25005 [Escherichia coli]
MSEINYQEGHEKAGQAKPVAWRYRYVKKGVTDFQEKMWVGDWKYVPTKEDCNDRPNYEIQALFTAPPVPLTPEGLIKAVRFYELVKRLAHSLKYANSLSSLPDKAMEYLNQNGLISVEDVLR